MKIFGTAQALAKKERLPPGKIALVKKPTLYAAIVAAREASKAGPVAVAAIRTDFKPPEGFSVAEWRMAWERVLEEWHVAPIYLGNSTAEVQEVEAAIRGFLKAQKEFRQEISRFDLKERRQEVVRTGGRIFGRPPYGYRIVGGEIQIHSPERTEAIRTIFSCYDDNPEAKPADVITAVRKVAPGESWDRTKIRRILLHRDLYETGTYHPVVGKPLTSPALTILRKAKHA